MRINFIAFVALTAIFMPLINTAKGQTDQPQQTFPAGPDLSSPAWQKHIHTLSEFVEPLDKTLALMEQGDGISYDDLVTCTKVLNQYAENIYVAPDDITMQANALKAKILAKSFSNVQVCWETANEAAHTGIADPSYDFKIALAKKKIAERDESMARAAQDGHSLSERFRTLAAAAGVPFAVSPQNPPSMPQKSKLTDADILRAAKTWRDQQLHELPGQIKANSEQETQVIHQMHQDGAAANDIWQARKPIQDERTELTRLMRVLKQNDDATLLEEYQKILQAKAEQQQIDQKQQQEQQQDRQQQIAQWETRVQRARQLFGWDGDFTLCPDCIGPQISALGANVVNGVRKIDGKQLPPDPNCQRCGGTGLVPAR